MKPEAVILVIISAFIHSYWNFLLKKGKNKSVFNCYMLLAATALYFPPFLYFLYSKEFLNIGWIFIILSAIFHTFYFYFLGKSYDKGHLSLTYPITRSSSIFVPFIALILIKEKLSIIGIVGIIIIFAGIYILHLRSFNLKSSLEPLKYIKEKTTTFALLTALFSAFYSVNDKVGIRYVSPFIYIYLITMFSSIFFLPILVLKKNRGDIKKEWNSNKYTILISGFLIILSYVLILFALKIDKVSYVVSLRQISVVVGVILGVTILKEEYGRIRLIGSTIMFIGFMLLAMA